MTKAEREYLKSVGEKLKDANLFSLQIIDTVLSALNAQKIAYEQERKE